MGKGDIKKLVVYLDQSFISDIAKYKAGVNLKVKDKLISLFDILKDGVNKEKVVVPDSVSIKNETAAIVDEGLKQKIRQYLKYLGQVSFKSPLEIQDIQFQQALLSFTGKEATKGRDYMSAFREDPDSRMSNFDIDVTFPPINFHFNETSLLQGIRDRGVKYQDQYKKEIDENRKVYKKKLKDSFSYFLYNYSIKNREAEEFIDSEEFKEIPSIDIFTKLWSKDLSKTGRRGKQSDLEDVEAISAYMPYCDVLTTDNYMATNIKELNLDKKYNCYVFTMKDFDLDKMNDFLLDDLEKRAPANKSIFSIVCYPANKDDGFNPEFVSLLNSAIIDYKRRKYNFDENIYISVLFIRNFDIEEEFLKNIYKDNGKIYLKNNNSTATEMQIFYHNFESCTKHPKDTLLQTAKQMADHKKGEAIVFIPSNFNEIDLDKTKDIDLIDDIGISISERKEKTKKYKFDIIYNK